MIYAYICLFVTIHGIKSNKRIIQKKVKTQKKSEKLLEVPERAIDPIQGRSPQDQRKIPYQNRITLAQKFPYVTFK